MGTQKTINFRIEFGSCSNEGDKYLGLNQDAFLTKTFQFEQKKVFLWGVFDGHNLLGELASNTAVSAFVDFFQKHFEKEHKKNNTLSIDDYVLYEAFNFVDKQIRALYKAPPKQYKFPVSGKLRQLTLEPISDSESSECTWNYVFQKEKRLIEFGTTAIIALLIDTQLIVASLGDSACYIAKKGKGGSLIYEKLSINHDNRNMEEVKRLTEIHPDIKWTNDGYVRIIDKLHKCEHQLAMTRALGHTRLSQFGIISKPDIKRYQLTDKDAFLVLVTDGVTNSLSDQEIINYVSDYENPQEAANSLVENAIALASNEKDNTTAVIVYF